MRNLFGKIKNELGNGEQYRDSSFAKRVALSGEEIINDPSSTGPSRQDVKRNADFMRQTEEMGGRAKENAIQNAWKKEKMEVVKRFTGVDFSDSDMAKINRIKVEAFKELIDIVEEVVRKKGVKDRRWLRNYLSEENASIVLSGVNRTSAEEFFSDLTAKDNEVIKKVEEGLRRRVESDDNDEFTNRLRIVFGKDNIETIARKIVRINKVALLKLILKRNQLNN